MTDPATILLRPMEDDDLAAVLAVQAACYPPPMQEAADVVLARRRAAAATTLVACVSDSDSAGVCGYLFAYPSLRGAVTALGARFVVPEAPDTLYLHDLAIAPRALGQGLARRLVERMHAMGWDLGLAHAALVSVQDTRRFWEAQGYRATDVDAGALAGYPDGALAMAREL